MDEIGELIEGFLDGRVSRSDLRAWANASRAQYSRPQRPDIDDPDFEEWVDCVSDWEIRTDHLLRILSDWSTAAEEESAPERKIAILTAICEIGPVFREAVVMGPAYLLGVRLAEQGQFREAAHYLELAERGLPARPEDADIALAALDRRIECLIKLNEQAEAEQAAQILIEKARLAGLEVYLASGLMYQAQIAEAAGRPGALELARQAVALRLEATAPLGAPVRHASWFLNAHGRMARDHGRYQEAITAFLKWADLSDDPRDRALAWSEVGYTYQQAGETATAATYLAQAGEMARAAGDEASARRWGLQAAWMRGEYTEIAPHAPQKISDVSEAYALATDVELLAASDRYEEAMPLAQLALTWAQQHNNIELQINMLNVLAAGAARGGDRKTAVTMFQRAIYLADRHSRMALSIMLRGNLASAQRRWGMDKEAQDVIVAGLAFAQTLKAQSVTSEERQEIAASCAWLYELYATLAYEYGEGKKLVETTDMSRAENLFHWSDSRERLIGSAVDESLIGLVDSLRAIDVEHEVRHLARQVTLESMQTLGERQRVVEVELREALGHKADDILETRSAQRALTPRVEELLAGVATREASLLYLFCVDKGVCAVLMPDPAHPGGIRSRYLPWPRAERRRLLSDWGGRMAPGTRGGGLAAPAEAEERAVGNASDSLDRLYGELADIFYRPLEDLLREGRAGGRDLWVVPHAETSLLPLWPLIDRCAPGHSLCVAPSVAILGLCARRNRPPNETAVLMRDPTGSLRHAETELEQVRGQAGLPCRVAATIEELVRESREASLIHLTAHGIFDEDVPYYSGLILRTEEQPQRIISRYVGRSGPSGTPSADGFRLHTVAECLTELDLRSCRLAVLSACESGLSRLHASAEMTGLPAAFLLAGAKSVVASLWRVNDAATTVLMGHFYSALKSQGRDWRPAAALAAARRRLRKTTRREAAELLGSDKLPPGEHPFERPIFTDAFMCNGAM